MKHTLEMRNIVKRFPGVLANNRVNLTIQSGEIHALLGENGAGKSTLMQILYGFHSMDSGEIFDRRQARAPGEPEGCNRAGNRHGASGIHAGAAIFGGRKHGARVARGLRADARFAASLREAERIEQSPRAGARSIGPGRFAADRRAAKSGNREAALSRSAIADPR